MKQNFDAVVCGAGIGGIAAAHGLTEAGIKRVLLIDPGPPLSLTSDKSTECYRNWWPGPDDAMVSLTNRSIELMEGHARASCNRFLMNRRGYLFATANPNQVATFETQAIRAEELGTGKFRHIVKERDYHPAEAEGIDSTLDGADLITNRNLIRKHFPYLNPQTVAVLHARCCGSLSAQQMGIYLLERARAQGVHFLSAALTDIETAAGRVSGVILDCKGIKRRVSTENIVLSTGPYLRSSGKLLGIDIPVLVEKHIKISLPDPAETVPRSAPLIVWSDPIDLPWSEEDKVTLSESDETRYLTQTFPAGVHGRPVGRGSQVLMYWTYDCEAIQEPIFPLDWDPYLPEITLRGMAVMVPGLERYFDPMPKPYVDGGYYTKTKENRPLIGPLGIPGAFICSAFSGFGIMTSCASGELLARYVAGKNLPSYAAAFELSRYDDPTYSQNIKEWEANGQL